MRDPSPWTLPAREWDRATELVHMFAMTGFVANETPQSMLFISEPGSGKTELLERFTENRFLKYASDLTSRGMHQHLRAAKTGALTHIVATEFQKFFLRKSSVAEATLGMFCQAMEEGVGEVFIGDKSEDFGGAQLGLIGAMTGKTVDRWEHALREYGFWSRCVSFKWSMSLEELSSVMDSISRNDKSDLVKVVITPPDRKIRVDFPVRLSGQFKDFVMHRYREHTVLRVFVRFRALAMACALIDGRDTVRAVDVEKVVSFDAYWSRMIRG